MKEAKVYMKLPKCCADCYCYNEQFQQCKVNNSLEMTEYDCRLAYEYECYSDKERHKNCPLIDIKTHDRELVAKVFEKIKSKFNYYELVDEIKEEIDFDKMKNYILHKMQELEGEDDEQ